MLTRTLKFVRQEGYKLEKVLNFFWESLGLNEPEIMHQVQMVAKREHVPKGRHVVKVGEMQNHLLVLISGILRGYIIDESGQDITDCFVYSVGDVVIGCNGLAEPSLVEIESLTECELIRIPVSTLTEWMEKYPPMQRVYGQFLEEALKRHWGLKRILYMPAMQRYQWFLTNYPGLIARVSNKYIASFLGMTPVTLSRLRRKLREDNLGPDSELITEMANVR